MKTDSGTHSASWLALILFASALTAQPIIAAAQTAGDNPTVTTSQSSTPSLADSQVRIVRLSQISGEVQIDRHTGEGFEPALLNLPVTQDSILRTGTGVAEVEFEDNSTLRLTPNTVVKFTQLEVSPSGVKASTLDVQAGTVYASLEGIEGDDFALTFGQQKVLLSPSSHIRLHLRPTAARLAVLGGSVQVEQPTGAMSIGKKHTATFDLAKSTAPTVARKVFAGLYDTWDQNAIDYHKLNAKSSVFGSPSNLSGISDMGYYGSFVNVDGCGRMWRPYFADARWDPFMNGSWAWYPGSGYSWVSPYPWGWTPYHSGSWEYCQANGWGWRPGGSWVGLKNAPQPRPPRHGILPVPRPPQSHTPGTPTLVVFNPTLPVASRLVAPDKFVVARDSAGLGIPRGSLGHLRHMSGQVEQRGSASLAVRNAPPLTSAGNGRAASYGSSSSGSAPGRSGPASYAGGHSGGTSYSRAMERASSAGDMGHMASAGASTSIAGSSMGGGGSAHK